jgi:ferredoxin-NADP reductase/ferredoxin
MTAQINEQLITLLPKETVLQAALRSGLDFPNSCRVGGCASCKCKLATGEVKQLTDTSYLLSKEELEQGYILACQSIPKSDIRVEVELNKEPQRKIAGRVIAQERVTHDIMRLSVQLEETLAYRAGQFCKLSIDSAEGPGVDIARSYSFGTPCNEQGTLTFYVRKVPGGKLSSFLNDQDAVGQRVMVEGPSGDFWLRDGNTPLLMIAGGSGLAPILAMLQQAAAEGIKRPVTLIFGAREERDLYAQAELEALAQTWGDGFRFIPVLSQLAPDARWSGERGLIADKLPALIEPDAQAYLCGPPAMVDSAAAVLLAHGVAPTNLHADRFLTAADTGAALEPAPRADALLPPNVNEKASALQTALDYLKYFLFHGIGLFSLIALLAGNWYGTAGLLTVLLFYILGDALLGDDTRTPHLRHKWLLTGQLWLALPLLMTIVFTAVWTVCPGDPLGYGAWLSQWSGYDVLAARASTSLGHHVAGWVLTGLMIGMVGTIPAHELTHRTWDPVSMFVGRWLLAFSFDTTFAIEHVYGHHRYVSTTEDPATAPRGRNVYFHVLSSTVRGNLSAWNIEVERLAKKNRATLSWHNAFLRGHAMSVLLVVLAWLMGGWQAAAFFIACALWGKALLEIVNYMEHYGMVRNPATPVQPRHSWNTNRRVSSWAMFNLTRHSHHHAQGEVPYQDLRPYPDAPMMIGGYLTTLLVAMIPPLWHALMTPKVLDWDRNYASEEERLLAASANRKSGIHAMQSSPSQSPQRVLPERFAA